MDARKHANRNTTTNLNDTLMSTRPEDVTFFDREDDTTTVDEHTGRRRKRRWFNLATGGEDDTATDWLDKSRVDEKHKQAVNQHEGKDYRPVPTVSILGFLAGVVAMTILVILTPLAQGGWRLATHAPTVIGIAVATSVMAVCVHIVNTADREVTHPWRTRLASVVIAVVLMGCAIGVGFFAAQATGKVPDTTFVDSPAPEGA